MNRRDFLQRCAAVVISATVASRIPVSCLPGPIRRYGAIEYMRQAYNEYAKLYHEAPEYATAGSELYESYCEEIISQRKLVSVLSGTRDGLPTLYRGVMFKNTLVVKKERGWYIEFFARRPIDLQGPDMLAVQV